MPDLPAYLTAPEYVRAVDYGHVTVLIDYRYGGVRCLLPPAGEYWIRTAQTGHSEHLPPKLASSLLEAGLLHPSTEPAPWHEPLTANAPRTSWGSIEHAAGIERPPAVPEPAATLATNALNAVATAMAGDKSAAMRRVIGLVTSMIASDRVQATPAQAREAVLAVRRAAWYRRARTSCLETSAAAAILIASRRLSITWCHGVAPDPVRLHAWLQTPDGQPVAEPESTLSFTPVLTLGGPCD
jgi:Transglutaminase-like superfamily